MSRLYAFGLGIASRSRNSDILDCYFPCPLLKPETDLAELITSTFDAGVSEVTEALVQTFAASLDDGNLKRTSHALAQSGRALTAVRLDADCSIESTEAAYLKLHLLSHRLTLPNTLNLDGIFAHLNNVAWTSAGPIAVEELPERLLEARLTATGLEVYGVDKFPRMTNYVVPTGVRIADASRIRLGAYLGEGTTVMPHGFVNFNAGAVGPAMVEGRISQGVIVGAHSDLGGGASTMGTLSGGGEIKISIGESCLVGANGGTGIPLGDRCTIAAGVYVTASTPVSVLDETGNEVVRVKARELAGQSDMLFIRNDQTGQIQCRTNRKAIALNDQLHAHN